MEAQLPIEAHLDALVRSLKVHGSAVLQAPTGAGKTTRVPLALANEFPGKILVLQPRRLAARGVAQRMAEQTHTDVGTKVGYHVRFDKCHNNTTQIVVMTDGIFLRYIQKNPFLEGVSAVVLDEFHERNLNGDLALALVRQVQLEVASELKLLVMSATLEPSKLSHFLDDCPVIQTEGRSYPVEIEYLQYPNQRRIAYQAVDAVIEELERTKHDILVFLPGVGEISSAKAELEKRLPSHRVVIQPLHGSLDLKLQRQALEPAPVQKVVLATNIAETSLTIPSIRTVIDSGLARVNRMDSETGFNRLELEAISQASATQRAGRAGRTAPGHCRRLWTERENKVRRTHLEPELHRVDLCDAVLLLMLWGENDIQAFPWFEKPSPERVGQATALLEQLGAVEDGRITPRGKTLAGLPVHPRLGVLLLEAAEGHFVGRAATAAALLSERDPFAANAEFDSNGVCDIDIRVRAFNDRQPSLNPHRARSLQRVIDQLRSLVRPSGFARTSEDAFNKALLAAFPDRVARRRKQGSARALMVGGKGVKLHPSSRIKHQEYFLCLRITAGASGPRSEATVYWATPIEPSWLNSEPRTVLVFDPEGERVQALEQLHYRGLVISERPSKLPDDDTVSALLYEKARPHLTKWIADDAATEQFLARIAWLAKRRPELALPEINPSFLEVILRTECSGRRSFEQLRAIDWSDAIAASFTWQQLQQLDNFAPERWLVPSGSQIRLDYSTGDVPILRVRIQELFGQQETPRINEGRDALLLHLLAPNMRPQQITSDLQSFWSGSYQDVRKEMRQRYPKHAWPENPFTALPERRPKKNKSKA